MKVSHIIYKVENLDNAVKYYRELGFTVEYGTTKNPYNALIFFSEGPYIELLAGTGMPSLVKKIMRFFGMRNIIDRLDYWDNHDLGPCGLALETYENNVEREKEILLRHGIKCSVIGAKRDDVKGRKLRFKVAYPSDISLPFL